MKLTGPAAAETISGDEEIVLPQRRTWPLAAGSELSGGLGGGWYTFVSDPSKTT
jgi:hypothetical protein